MLSDIKSKGEIIVYPNPVKKGNTFTLQLNSNFSSEKIETQIINYLGQTSITDYLVSKSKFKYN